MAADETYLMGTQTATGPISNFVVRICGSPV